jgi:hypothetical protein
MPTRRFSMLVRAGSALSLALVIGACTSGGQFDPTEVLSSDIFNTKKRVQGDREPLFPNGVPGTETGVPPDLVKGYQPPPEPPPEQSADTGDAAAKPAAAAAKPEEKPKPKPKPKVARQTPATPAHDAAWDQKAGSITSQPAPAAAPPAQTNWPAPPATQVQTNWPAPPPTQSSQTNWPAPPPKPGQ